MNLYGIIAAVVGTAWLAEPATAAVDLQWHPLTQTVAVGQVVEISLYAVSDDPGASQPIASLDVLPGYDPLYVELLGNADTGPYAWLWSTFPDDSGGDGMNNTWDDGNAKYTALAQPGEGGETYATPAGLLVTTLRFSAVQATPPGEPAELYMIPEYGLASRTVVHPPGGGDVTGTLSDHALITIVPEPSALPLLVAGTLVCLCRSRPGRRMHTTKTPRTSTG